VILIALTAGTIVGGITGAVLAVPIAAVAWAIAKVWNSPPAAAETERGAELGAGTGTEHGAEVAAEPSAGAVADE
jgi:hypothetical protein